MANGVVFRDLTPSGFLDLVHHYLLLVTDPDEHAKLNRELIGTSAVQPAIDEQAGFAPPSWWKGDEYASRSGAAARVTMRR